MKGDNVVNKSDQTPWYHGATMLEHLEGLNAQDVYEVSQARLPIQTSFVQKQKNFMILEDMQGNSMEVL